MRLNLQLQLFAYKGNSVVDYLNSEGKDSSFSARKQLAESAGISNYTGTASQNTQLLSSLRSGTSGAAANTAADAPAAANTVKSNIPGVSDATYAGMNKEFAESGATAGLKDKSAGALGNYETHTNKTNIVDQSVKDKMNTQFVKPSSVVQAESYLDRMLAQIQSGKTSYSDQVDDMISKITNREDFEYDPDSDQLFQQALASAMNSGKSAMQDTIGQASALTGGYGSTYATSAGNQAYNAFIEDAYNNLPEYYQMALQAYQMEGEEMYQQYGMLSDADAREYGRMVDAYNATSQHRNQAYNEAYALHQDSVNNAYNYANLQLNEHGQVSNDLFNLYSAYANEYDRAHNKEWSEYVTGVQNAYQMAGLEQNGYWNQKNFDESVRQFNVSQASRGGSGGGGFSLSDTEISKAKEIIANGGTMDDVLIYLSAKDNLPQTEEEMNVLKSVLGDGSVEKYGNTGTVSQFRTTEGDNFNIKVGDKYYGIENKGKVADSDLVKELKTTGAKNGDAFLYDGDAYVKHAGGYYKVGAMAFGGKAYQELLKALQ